MTEWIVTSSGLIMIVIALRGLLKGKISLKLQYGLWALVLVRLLLPFSITDSAISIANILSVPTITEADNALTEYKDSYESIRNDYTQRGETFTNEELRVQAQQALQDKTYEKLEKEYAQSGSQVQNPQVQEEIRQEVQQQVAVISLTALIADALPYLWLIGMILVGAVLIGSNIHFGWKLHRSRKALDLPNLPAKVYLTDYVATPCLFGIGKPDIYLTNEVMEDSRMRSHVLAHEMSHYRQGDHIWSVLRCLCLVLHWYNPLVWAAAILSKQDAELACDEATIKTLGEQERLAYGRTLVGMTCVRRDPRSLMLAATTMLGTKKTLKERVMLIAKKPKTALVTLIACVLVTAMAVGCTFTGAPTDPTGHTGTDDAVWEQLNEAVNTVNSAESRHFSSYLISEHPGEVDLEGVTPVNDGWIFDDDFYLDLYGDPHWLNYDGTFYGKMSDGTWLVDRNPNDDENDFDAPLPTRNAYTMFWTQTEEYLDVVLRSDDDENESILYRMDVEGKLLWYAATGLGSVVGVDGVQAPAELYTVCVLHDTAPADVREKVETSAAEILATMVEWDGDPNTEPTEPKDPSNAKLSITNIRNRAIEENLAFPTAFELFFTDAGIKYYFPGVISPYIIVTYDDGSSEDIVSALNAGRATIADLDRFGIQYISGPSIEVAEFQDLLTNQNGYWYWRAMGCVFENPEELSLQYLFYNGLKPDEQQDQSTYTDNEVAFLKDLARNTWGDESSWVNAHKMPRAYIRDVLNDYFGLTLEDVTIPDEWSYLAETDSYYFIRSDAYGVARQTVTDVQSGDNGLIYVYWTTDHYIYDTRYEDHVFLENPQMVMVLQQKNDGSYIVLSNLPFEIMSQNASLPD